MGYLWRVRLSSFLAGTATASAAGFFFIYKDHLLARAAIARQVRGRSDVTPPLAASELIDPYFDSTAPVRFADGVATNCDLVVPVVVGLVNGSNN